MDFELISKAGLKQKEFADLLGVTRTTVNLWVTGKMKPHRLLRTNVERALAALTKGIDSNQLPTHSKTNPSIKVVSELLAAQPAENTVS